MSSIDPVHVFQNFSDIEEELDLMEKSFQNIQRNLKKVLHQKTLRENEKAFCENLIHKCDGQSIASAKLKKRAQVIYSDSSTHFLDQKMDKLARKMEDL
ncbi:MAG: hypothetical protein IJI60_01475 [Bacilli bacterium]|nr:hypothetical protein [Bacilli bacterium]